MKQFVQRMKFFNKGMKTICTVLKKNSKVWKKIVWKTFQGYAMFLQGHETPFKWKYFSQLLIEVASSTAAGEGVKVRICQIEVKVWSTLFL